MTFDTDTINNIKFTQGFRGYDTAEVDEFLDDMIREIEKLNNTIKNLKEEVAKEKRKNQLNQQEIDRLTEINEELSANAPVGRTEAEEQKPEPPKQEEPQPVKIKKPTSLEDIKGTPEYEDMKQILTDTLLSAQQHAEKLVKDANTRAVRLVEEGERRAQDRVVALNVEIVENQRKLNALKGMVSEAKQRFKRDFQNQISALDSIDVGEKAEVTESMHTSDIKVKIADSPEVEKPEAKQEVIIEPENVTINTEKQKMPTLDEMADEKQKQEEKKIEEHTNESEEKPEVSTFDFSAIKKSLSTRTDTNPVPEEKLTAKEETSVQQSAPTEFSSEEKVEEENKQYIEVALSAYNDNKHHNTDYPNTQKNIKINEEDEEGGIYQPENRSVLSSVIEEILNNRRNDD